MFSYWKIYYLATLLYKAWQFIPHGINKKALTPRYREGGLELWRWRRRRCGSSSSCPWLCGTSWGKCCSEFSSKRWSCLSKNCYVKLKEHNYVTFADLFNIALCSWIRLILCHSLTHKSRVMEEKISILMTHKNSGHRNNLRPALYLYKNDWFYTHSMTCLV